MDNEGFLLGCMLAKMTSKDDLVKNLQVEIDKYTSVRKLDKDGDREFNGISAVSLLINLKSAKMDPHDLAKEMDEFEIVRRIIKPSQQ